MLLQPLTGQRIEPWIGRLCDRFPRNQHLTERGSACRSAVCKELINLREGHQSLPIIQEIFLLLPGQMSHIPADAIHRLDSSACVVICETAHGALEFAASKS